MIASGALLARVNEIADPGALVVKVDADDVWGTVLLTRKGGAIAAFHNRCAHAGYPLQHADGRVLVQQGRYIVCGAHGASYELKSGACAGGPCNGDALTRIAIVVKAGEIRAA
ncbi:MAG: Rieske 2Fe-2S domain-containing protein [Vitreimonas sp.]